MSEPTPGTIELTCPGCQAYFRLKPKKGKFPKGPIPCPKCQTSIPMNIPRADASPSGVSTPGAAIMSAPQSGVLSRSKIRKGPSTTPSQKSLSTMSSEAEETRSSIDDAFLRAADQLLEGVSHSPTSTFQGFGIAENIRRTSPQPVVYDPDALIEEMGDKNSTTDTSHFHREDATKAIDPDVIDKIKAAHQHDTPVGGVDIMNTQTPVGGVNPLSAPFSAKTFAESNEPGPFDMRDILDAERHKLEGSDPNEITHNPLLNGEPVVETPDMPREKPRPGDAFGMEMSLGAHETLASDEETFDHTEASSSPPAMHHEPLASRSDIFTDASSSPPSEATRHDEHDETTATADSSPSRSNKPLAAMLRKKFGADKLDTLRDALNEPSSPHTVQPAAPHADLDSSPDQSAFSVGADEDDLAKILDEADSKRPSGEHHSFPQGNLHSHPTRPSLHVSDEISRRLASISPPSISGDSEPVEAPPIPSAESIGARFKKRLQQDRSPDLEPGKPPAVKGSSLLAKLKPNRVSASDITGDIPIARHLQDVLDEASIPAEDAASGTFNRFDLTPQRGDDVPHGISWASSDSIAASSAAFQDHAQHVTRKRRRQESHSGLFPISGGIGQEDSMGFASERKGSGYIRLPTSEIIDVLGKGQYRLLVEDIVYEPVDEIGLTELVKRGVILGAEKIAEHGGEWRPINEHPVFRRLKKKMAIEAHALLAKYRQPATSEPSSSMDADSEDIEAPALPLPNTENPLKGKDFSAPTPSVIERLDDLSAELDEDSSPEKVPPSIPVTAQLHAVDEPEPSEQAISEAIEQDAPIAKPAPLKEDAPQQELEQATRLLDDAPISTLDEESSMPQGTSALDHDDPLTHKKRSPWLPVVGLLVLGGLVIGGVLLTQPELRQQLFGAATQGTPEVPTGPDGITIPSTPEKSAIVTAMTQASSALMRATDIKLGERDTQLALAKSLGADGDLTHANLLYGMAWTPKADPALTEEYARSLTSAKDYATLRQLAMMGLASGNHGALYDTLRQEALAQDTSLRELTFTEIGKTSHGDSMELVNSDQGLIFKLRDTQGQLWAFHPAQSRYSEAQWHRDVTAWRLCQLIVCGITIPEVSQASMSAEVFDHLMSSSGSGAAPPSERYNELAWTQEGSSKQIKGTLTRWVEPGAFWPFPYTNTWRPWLAAYEDAALMSAPLTDALDNMSRSDEDLYKALITQNPDMTTTALAQQLSSAITFDFLTNNMNRFKERVAYNGARDNQVRDGRFHSLDHGTAMSSRLSSRVKGRFDWVQRFDRAMIESLRTLDPESSDAILFPEGSSISRSEQQAFWARHEKLLKEVDARVIKYGKENVLYFE